MNRSSAIFFFMLFMVAIALTSARAQDPNPAPPKTTDQSVEPAQSTPGYSGMYTFLKEGEFVQITVEDAGIVTGFISRYGDGDSGKATFQDQFFKTGHLDGPKLVFTTQAVHGVWFDFKGAIERGEGKNPGDENYYVIKGTLTQSSTDANKKVSSKSQSVEFKMFPQEADSPTIRN
jgi:hypothetical protein